VIASCRSLAGTSAKRAVRKHSGSLTQAVALVKYFAAQSHFNPIGRPAGLENNAALPRPEA
jgi:hypothetical protein